MTEGLDLGEVATATTRRCVRCRQVRAADLFYPEIEARKTAKLGRPYRMHCRICQREKNDAHRAERQRMVDSIKVEAGCADRGLRDDDPVVYDFDHVRGTKLANVSALLTKGTDEDLLAEIGKCDVVCACCHRKRTKRRKPAGFGVSHKTPRTPL